MYSNVHNYNNYPNDAPTPHVMDIVKFWYWQSDKPMRVAMPGQPWVRTQSRGGQMPKNQHHPTRAERDERVKIDLPPDEAIADLGDRATS